MWETPSSNFESVEYEITKINRQILSKDKMYALDISYSIKADSCTDDLSVLAPTHFPPQGV